MFLNTHMIVLWNGDEDRDGDDDEVGDGDDEIGNRNGDRLNGGGRDRE